MTGMRFMTVITNYLTPLVIKTEIIIWIDIEKFSTRDADILRVHPESQ